MDDDKLLLAAAVELDATSASLGEESALKSLSRDRKLEIASSLASIATRIRTVVSNRPAGKYEPGAVHTGCPGRFNDRTRIGFTSKPWKSRIPVANHRLKGKRSAVSGAQSDCQATRSLEWTGRHAAVDHTGQAAQVATRSTEISRKQKPPNKNKSINKAPSTCPSGGSAAVDHTGQAAIVAVGRGGVSNRTNPNDTSKNRATGHTGHEDRTGVTGALAVVDHAGQAAVRDVSCPKIDANFQKKTKRTAQKNLSESADRAADSSAVDHTGQAESAVTVPIGKFTSFNLTNANKNAVLARTESKLAASGKRAIVDHTGQVASITSFPTNDPEMHGNKPDDLKTLLETVKKGALSLKNLASVLGDESKSSLSLGIKKFTIKTIRDYSQILENCSEKSETLPSIKPLGLVSDKLNKLAVILEESINHLPKATRVDAAITIRNLVTVIESCSRKAENEMAPLELATETNALDSLDHNPVLKNTNIKVENAMGTLTNEGNAPTQSCTRSSNKGLDYYKNLNVSSEQFRRIENFPQFNTGKKPVNPTTLSGLNRMVTVRVDTPEDYLAMCDGLENCENLRNGSLNIEKISCNKHGKSTIICETEAQKETLKATLTNMNLKPEDARIKNFSFAIFGIQKHKTSDSIASELSRRDKMRFKKEDFVISERFAISKTKDAVVLSCKESMRTAIIEKPFVFLGTRRYTLNNFIELIQCFNCSKFGHKTNRCPKKTPSCPNCAGNHSLKDCESNFTPKCSNCSLVTVEENRHSSWDVRCPYRRLWIGKQKKFLNG